MASKNTPATTAEKQILPEPLTRDRFLRVHQVLEIFPVARSTWWAGVKAGHYPKGIKLSERTTAWRLSEIEALIERLSADAQA